MKNVAVAAIAAVLPCGLAAAQGEANLFVGLGYEDVQDLHSGALGGLLEYASPTFGANDGFRWRVAGMTSTDGDIWIGIGASYEFGLGESPYFIELSFLPGAFYRGNANGSEEEIHVPEFRSQVGIGYRWDDGQSLSVTLSHRSNGRLDGPGSAMETVTLRYGMPLEH